MKNRRNYIFFLAAAMIVLFMILTVLGWHYYVRRIEKNSLSQLTGADAYDRHYVLIPDDADSGLWQEIYNSAKKTAEQRAEFYKNANAVLLNTKVIAAFHHGELEYGSPKKPALAEAIALNMADNMDAKMETIKELFNSAPTNDGWLGYNRLFESNFRKSTKYND